MLSSTSCARHEVIVSGDLSCDRFRHISANDEQRAAIKSDWTLWESFARQIADHNDTYDGACSEPAK